LTDITKKFAGPGISQIPALGGELADATGNWKPVLKQKGWKPG